MDNAQILETVCREFNDTLFEDKWDALPQDSVVKYSVRTAMKKALLKLWELRPSNDFKGGS